jgi:hypothetical protein
VLKQAVGDLPAAPLSMFSVKRVLNNSILRVIVMRSETSRFTRENRARWQVTPLSQRRIPPAPLVIHPIDAAFGVLKPCFSFLARAGLAHSKIIDRERACLDIVLSACYLLSAIRMFTCCHVMLSGAKHLSSFASLKQPSPMKSPPPFFFKMALDKSSEM